MNIKNLLLPLGLALVTTWAIQYFVINRYYNPEQSTVQSGRSFTAPQSQVEAQPLLREVDFIDADIADTQEGVQTRVEADHATYLFSTKGATLEQLTFKRIMNDRVVALKTIEAPQGPSRDTRNFLVALAKKTPLNYALVDQKSLESATQLTYKAETEQAVIEKIFTIDQTKFKIDLEIKIAPKKDPVQVRLFYGSPSMPTVKDDVISAVYNTEKGSIQKEARGKLDMNKGWFMPNFFGSESRYFVHAMISDQNNFAQRAYYSLIGQDGLISILEGASIDKPAQWKLSFYFGPKEDDAMNQVDPRLEQTLEHSGWLAPLSRLLLMFLKYLYSFLHNYGWAIVLMTLIINLVLLPLNIKSAQGMKKYAEFQKKLKYIEQRYKDDPDTLARERQELIAKHGLPGMGGCLPKLIQIPIFFALSRVLSSSIELYKAPFILWIKDLSAPDPLHILPLLIVIAMLFQSTATEPKQRFMMIAVALVFGAFSVNFSAGLCLYILVGIVLMNIQTFIQTKLGWA